MKKKRQIFLSLQIVTAFFAVYFVQMFYQKYRIYTHFDTIEKVEVASWKLLEESENRHRIAIKFFVPPEKKSCVELILPEVYPNHLAAAIDLKKKVSRAETTFLPVWKTSATVPGAARWTIDKTFPWQDLRAFCTACLLFVYFCFSYSWADKRYI